MKGRLSARDDAVLAKMPPGKFTAKDLALGSKAGGMLAGMEGKGLIRKAGTTGRLGRTALWERV